MKSLIPFMAGDSIKNLRSFLRYPRKIYSVEIKIKSEDLQNSTATTESTVFDAKANEKHKSETNLAVVGAEKSVERPFTVGKTLSHGQIIEQTLQIVKSVKNSLRSNSISNLILLNTSLKDLYVHLQTYPAAANLAIRQNISYKLIKIRELSQRKSIRERFGWLDNESSRTTILRKTYSKALNENSRQVLSLLGHTDPPKGRGIRVLSIDGGGTRGLISIEVLRQIERYYGQPIHKIFDLICGVSTGAIIAMLLGALRISIDECETYYRHVSSNLFKTDFFRGTGRLLWSHAYYDSALYDKILKEIFGETVLIHTKKNQDCPHMVVISAIVNMETLEPYLFRNYELHPSSKPLSHFEGGSGHKIWEAVRASSAAPGYFEEFTIGKHVHQDGGILLNNPTAVAVHEAKLLWPNEQIQCVVSLGSGRYQPASKTLEMDNEVALSSLKQKIVKLIDSATDTEMVHRLMQDLMPPGAYYRINPFLTDRSNIDENRPEKFQQMIQDAQMYLRKNEHKFRRTLEQLKIQRTMYQTIVDNIQLKQKVYF